MPRPEAQTLINSMIFLFCYIIYLFTYLVLLKLICDEYGCSQTPPRGGGVERVGRDNDNVSIAICSDRGL